MTIAARLRKLELAGHKLVADGDASKRLLSRLESIYSRQDARELSTEVMAGQSNATALSIALFDPLPLKTCVTAKLQQIAVGEGITAKFARATLQDVT